MKRLFLTSVVLLLVFMAQAQTKIAPKLVKGYKAVYTEEMTVNVAGNDMVKLTSETEYTVSDVTADGAMITVKTVNVTDNSDGGNPMSSILSASMKMMEGVDMKVKTNADGQVQGIVNFEEVQAQVKKMSKNLIDKIYESSPELAQMLPREGLESQMLEKMDADLILASLRNTGVLSLNGKTISNGATDSYENEEGFKMKRMFFVAGKNIIVNSTLNMSKDELKALIIKQVEEQAPEQAEMIKQNIDMVMGQMKFEVTGKSTFTMQDNGWVKSVKTEASQEAMGQSTKSVTVTTLKQ